MTTSPMHSAFSGPMFEPIAEPLRGFRAWLIEDSAIDPPNEYEWHGFQGGIGLRLMRGALHGVFRTQYVWGSLKNESSCIRTTYPGAVYVTPPMGAAHVMTDCDCGFYAYTNGEHYISVPGPAALGVVEAWGRIIVGPLGFRAQYARILGITFPTATETIITAGRQVMHGWKNVPEDLRDAVQRLYPRVGYYSTVAALQAAHPLSDTSSFLPTTPEELGA